MAVATPLVAPPRGLEATRGTSDRHRDIGASSRGPAVSAGKNRTKYLYDAMGNRVRKYVIDSEGEQTTSWTDYYLDEASRIIAEGDESGTIVATYVNGNGIDEVLSVDRTVGSTTTRYFMHEDALGSVALVTDENGANVEKYEYSEYGLPTVYVWDAENEEWGSGTEGGASSVGNTRMFTGREWDAEIGLYYYRARHYDPKSGRFVSPDPIGMAGDDRLNIFAYTGNDPVDRWDPLGESDKDVFDAGESLKDDPRFERFDFLSQFWKSLLHRNNEMGAAVVEPVSKAIDEVLDPGMLASLEASGCPPEMMAGAVAEAFASLRGAYSAWRAARAASAAATAEQLAEKTRVLASMEKAFVQAAERFKQTKATVTFDQLCMDANKLHHIFGQAKHNLDGVVSAFGSQEAAFSALEKATQAAVDAAKTVGQFEMSVNVGGFAVTVRGVVINGVVSIGTAFR